MNKKKLYESIMKDVSKIVKKHLNENYGVSWYSLYIKNLNKWISNIINNSNFIKYVTDLLEQFDLTDDYVDNTLGFIIGEALALSTEYDSFLILPEPSDTTIYELVSNLIYEYSSVTDTELPKINNIDAVVEGFNDGLEYDEDNVLLFKYSNNEREANDLSYKGAYICDERGNWVTKRDEIQRYKHIIDIYNKK